MSFQAEYNKIAKLMELQVDNLLERKAQKIRRILQTKGRKYFAYIDQTYINKTNPPINWKPLKESTIKRKGHSRFHYFKGALRSYLKSENPFDVYNTTPSVRVERGKFEDGKATIYFQMFKGVNASGLVTKLDKDVRTKFTKYGRNPTSHAMDRYMQNTVLREIRRLK